MKNPGGMVVQELVGFWSLFQLQSGPENHWPPSCSPCGFLVLWDGSVEDGA